MSGDIYIVSIVAVRENAGAPTDVYNLLSQINGAAGEYEARGRAVAEFEKLQETDLKGYMIGKTFVVKVNLP
jgi:hypothetical protein